MLTQPPDRAHLRVLATTDLHGRVRAWDYAADRVDDAVGLTRVASLVRQARTHAPLNILVDNGDSLFGTPLTDHGRFTGAEDSPHAMIAAMNRLGYDAATLGNHDFDFGLPRLEAVLRQAEFPFVSANITRGSQPLLPSHVVLSRTVPGDAGRERPLRIGIAGLFPPPPGGSESLGRDIAIYDMRASARRTVLRLEALGCDVVVALVHGGIIDGPYRPMMENAAAHVAEIDGIDAVVAGHNHAVFPAPGQPCEGRMIGKPAVSPGFWGSHLGVIDIRLLWQDGRWRITNFASEVRPIAEARPGGKIVPLVKADPEICSGTEAAHAATMAELDKPVAKLRAPLHSYFARLGWSPALAAMARAMTTHGRELLGDSHGDLPLVAAVAPVRAGGLAGPAAYTDIAAGPVSRRSLSDAQPFPNTVAVLRLTGADLMRWLDHAARGFCRITAKTADGPLLDRSVPGFDCDLLFGASYRYDLAAPDNRTRDVTIGDRPLDPGDELLVATSNFRAAGGGGNAAALAGKVVVEGDTPVQDLLARTLASPEAAPGDRLVFRLCAPAGASAVFETGPGARAHLDALPGIELEDMGNSATGFACFRIRF